MNYTKLALLAQNSKATLDFLTGYYRVGGLTTQTLASVPGWSGITQAGTTYGPNLDGTVSTFAPNTARVTTRGLWFEAAATQNLLQTNDLTNAAWVDASASAPAPVKTGGQADPAGGTQAASVVFDRGTGFCRFEQTRTSLTSPYNFSAWMRKTVAGASIALRTTSGATTSSLNIGTTWAQYSVTETVGSNQECQFILWGNLGGPATDTVLIWQPQLVAGSLPGTPIPTTGTPVTRAADAGTLTVTGASFAVVKYESGVTTVPTPAGVLDLATAGSPWLNSPITKITVY